MSVTPPNSAPYLLAPDPTGSVLGAVVPEAEELFPPFDGVTSKLPDRPQDFDLDNPPRFRFWHTAHQLEYIKARGSDLSVTDGSTTLATKTIAIPPTAAPADQLHAIATADGRGVVILNDQTPATLQRLPVDDQRLAAGHPQFARLVAEPFGLATGGPAAARQAQKDRLDTLRQSIADVGPLPGVAGLDDDDPNRLVDPATLITRQLDVFAERLDRMAIFDPVAIDAKLAEFTERFERLRRYGTVEKPTGDPPRNAVSTDENQAIRAAYELFAQTEKRLSDIARIANTIAATGSFRNKLLDVPGLVVNFQALENQEGEEEARAATEEIRQRNTLLENYAAIQELVNRVSATFQTPTRENADAAKVRKTLFAGLSSQQREEALPIAYMFSSTLVDSGKGFHPAEAALGLNRPRMAVLTAWGGDNSFLKSEFDAFASSLGDATRTLDRDVQLLSDKVNRMSRERNRHFDLATQTLRRASDLVQTINRGIR